MIKHLLRELLAALRRFFGGGASYVILALLCIAALQYWQIGHVKTRLEKTEAAAQESRALLLEKDSLIAAQSRQFNRQSQSQKEQDIAEAHIRSVPDSSHCLQSLPVSSALERLRKRAAAQTQTHNDETDVSLPGGAEDPGG